MIDFGLEKDLVDGWGMIVHKTPQGTEDGGDSCQRMGMLAIGYWLNHSEQEARMEMLSNWYEGILEKLECPECPDHYRRHPDPFMWYSDCDRLSRDQATTLIIGMAVTGHFGRLLVFMLHHIKRFGFMTNTRHNWTFKDLDRHKYAIEKGWLNPTDKFRPGWKLPDFCGPEIMGLYVRSFGLWWLYPLLLISDIETLINAILLRYFKKDKTDVVNTLSILLFTKYVMPTPLTWLSCKILSKANMVERMKTYFAGPGNTKVILNYYEPFVEEIGSW